MIEIRISKICIQLQNHGVEWPVSGFKQLKKEHKVIMPKLSREQIEAYFLYRMADEIELPSERKVSVFFHIHFSDDETKMPSFSRTDMYLHEKSFKSFEFDDFDSQLLFEPEGADGISFSDAETQCPTNLSHAHASAELINATNSKTEIEIPPEVQETSIFIGFKRKQNEESSDSDTGSSHSEKLLKRMK
ncbi:Hypothetical predicted protein [Mytilus galloprovincialis]|uniref:Uncharacterized protein n=1 Tax=Mytilus galloprovincialis TaxID=29158 RepID=A0A8B6F0H5_MYTGA|nr:Hypothetical predicted protein [Mytilus galloprovincialis]